MVLHGTTHSAAPTPSKNPPTPPNHQLHKRFSSESTLLHPQKIRPIQSASSQPRLKLTKQQPSVCDEINYKSAISTPIDERILTTDIKVNKPNILKSAAVSSSHSKSLENLEVGGSNINTSQEVLDHFNLNIPTNPKKHDLDMTYYKGSSVPERPLTEYRENVNHSLVSDCANSDPAKNTSLPDLYSPVYSPHIRPLSSYNIDTNRISFQTSHPSNDSNRASPCHNPSSTDDELSENKVIPPPFEFRSLDLFPHSEGDVNKFHPFRKMKSMSPVPASFLSSLVTPNVDQKNHKETEADDIPPPVCYATMPTSSSSTFILTEISSPTVLPVFPITTVQPIPHVLATSNTPRFCQDPDVTLSSSIPSSSSPLGVITTLHSPLSMVAHSHSASPGQLHCTFPIHSYSSNPQSLSSSAESALDTDGYGRIRSSFQAVTGPQSNATSTAVSGNITAVTTSTATTSASSPLPAPQKMSVSDKMKFFEKAMEEQHQPSPKPEKVFSFLSQDEIERMKQEEEKKIASLSRSELKTLTNMVEHDEDDEDRNESHNDADSSFNRNSSTPPIREVPVRTAKAEKRRKERLLQEGILTDEEDKELSPAEQRSLRAEKRAAWRQARFKSLEQDALQAQMVIKKMSEMIDSDPNKSNSTPEAGTSPVPLAGVEETDTASFNNNNNFENNHLHHNNLHADGENNVELEPSPALLRPSSADFPKLALRAQEGATKVRESERLLGEKVTRKTEEYVDEASGMIKVRTVEYVEKLIEKEVETTREKIISLELCSPEDVKKNTLLDVTPPFSPTLQEEDEDEDNEEEEQQSSDIPSSTPTSPTTEDGPESINTNKKKRRKRSKKKH